MKKRVLCLMLCAFLGLCGCWDYSEIEDDSIISGMAIDKGENGKTYKMSLEIINTSSGSGGAPDEVAGEAPKVLTQEGDTVLECMRRIVNETSRVTFFSHCRIFLISEDVAREGILPVIDVILRNQELRMDIDIAVVRGVSAGELLKLNSTLVPVRAYEISQTIQDSARHLGYAPRVRFWQMVDVLNSDGIQLVLPTFEKDEDASEEEAGFVLTSPAVFSGDRLCGFLDDTQGQGYMLLTKQIKETVFHLVWHNDGQETVLTPEIGRYTVQILPEGSADDVSFRIRIKSDLSFYEIPPEVHLSTRQELDEMEEVLSECCAQTLCQSIRDVQEKYGVDIYGFGNLLYRKENGLWNEVSDRWQELFPTIRFSVEWDVTILGNGYSCGNVEIR